MPDDRPNVVWISFEDTSPRFGCFGDVLARTPNVDRVAREGRVYPNTFTTAPVCAPARSAVITGMYATAIGAHHMRTTHANPHTPELPTPYECVPPAYVKLLPELLRAEGYYCTNNAKTDYQFASPSSAWDECSHEAHWRNRPRSEQPFFAVFNLDGTHESGMWDERWRGRVPETDPEAVTVPPYLPDTPVVRECIARVYDNVSARDADAGDLLHQLEEDGLARDTIVFIWSDHGEGLPRHKRWPYDSGLRVPMVVRWPDRVEAGTRDERLVSTIDLAPTVLSMAGIAPPQHLQGLPFDGPSAQRRAHVFATRDRYDESYDLVRVVRDERYLYMQHGLPGTPNTLWIPYRDRHPVMQEIWRLAAEERLEGAPRWFTGRRPGEELYDCVADPHQVHNLADDPSHADTLARLRDVLEGWQRAHDPYRDVDEAEMVRRWWPD
ncbi:MAG: sulfatase, partial [Planctomycetota bacterium]